MKVTLKALRVNSGLTQTEAAQKIGVSRVTLKNWENSYTYPNMRQLARICETYGCGMADIFLPSEFALRE